MNLKQIAKPHTSGGITWLMIPFETLRDKHVFGLFASVLAFPDWDRTAMAFFVAETSAIEAVFAPTATPEEVRFKEYWQSRPASMAERWLAFTLFVTESIVDGIHEAYNATRDVQVEVVNDPEPKADAEPNTSNGGG